jgi:ribosomal protein L11 methyltransferase
VLRDRCSTNRGFTTPALDLSWTSGPETVVLIDLLYAALDEFEPIAIEDGRASAGGLACDGWRVFFRTPAARDSAATALRNSLATQLIHINPIEVSDDDWAARSQAALTAVRVGRFVITPPWDSAALPEPRPASREPRAASDIVIVIEPSTGFGTGHHETTRLCLEILQELDVARTRAIDVGTGSGILAIAAAKLGAAAVVAVDNDPEALRNARDNIARNGYPRTIGVLEADLGSLSLEPANIVTANLTAGVLVRYAGPLAGLLKDGGSLLVSGFGPDDVDSVAGSFDGLRAQRHVRDGDWVALLLGAGR